MGDSGVSWRNRHNAQSMPSCANKSDAFVQDMVYTVTYHGCAAIQSQDREIQCMAGSAVDSGSSHILNRKQ